MVKIGLDHWFIKDNILEISLWDFFISIEVTKNDKDIFYKVKVINSEREELLFNFYTLEEAVFFIEEHITKCREKEEVGKKYEELFSNENNPIIREKSNITLFPEDIDQAIINYFSFGKNYRISVEDKLEIENGSPKITYYIIEHIEYDGVKRKNKIRLTEGDLKNAFNEYIGDLNYEVEDFKYRGGIHHVGYHFDEDTPYFEGIELKVKEKGKDKVLEKRVKYE